MMLSGPVDHPGALPRRGRDDPMPAAVRERAARVLLDAAFAALGPDPVEAALVKGSAVKGDSVPGYSDFDFHLFVQSDRVPTLGGLRPAPGPALAFQKAIGGLDPAGYGVSSFRVHFVDSGKYPAEWLPPLPGTCEIVYGNPPVGLPVPGPRDIIREAGRFFGSAPQALAVVVERVLDKPDGRLPALVRELQKYVVTDFSPGEMLDLVRRAPDYSLERAVVATVPTQ
ncbi:MAG: hypothetical protein K6U89_18830, partial [Chloroflexi bacterium]|nr:hypothetical protein [Chloroflexota bacterium]